MIRDAFAFDWDADLPAAERDKLLAALADQIARRGMQTPAIWMLETHRPLIPIAGHASVAFSPFLGTLFSGGAVDMQKVTKLMRDTANIDLLIREIERRSEEIASATRV